MDLQLLESRFEFYAQNSVYLKHIPGDKFNRAFTSFDIENMHAAIENGVKFPCLFLETPSTEKEGINNNVSESYETSIMVLNQMIDGDYNSKSRIVDECKAICDKIYNRMIQDAPEYFESQLSKTTEGIITTSNNLVGWMVAFGFTVAYDAEVDANDWEDLN